jgi:hypothetical protein
MCLNEDVESSQALGSLCSPRSALLREWSCPFIESRAWFTVHDSWIAYTMYYGKLTSQGSHVACSVRLRQL